MYLGIITPSLVAEPILELLHFAKLANPVSTMPIVVETKLASAQLAQAPTQLDITALGAQEPIRDNPHCAQLVRQSGSTVATALGCAGGCAHPAQVIPTVAITASSAPELIQETSRRAMDAPTTSTASAAAGSAVVIAFG